MAETIKPFPYWLYFMALSWFSSNEAAKILGVTFVPAYSHQELFEPIWRKLSLRGHNVTLISSHILNDSSLTNLTEIDTSASKLVLEEGNIDVTLSKNNFFLSNVLWMQQWMRNLILAQLEHEEVQRLINNYDEHFDVVVVEGLFPIVYAYGGRFQAPVNEAAKILGVTFVPAYSHQELFEPIWKKLSLRGHDVTVISSHTLNDSSLTNLTEIDTGSTKKVLQDVNIEVHLSINNFFPSNVLWMQQWMRRLMILQLDHAEVQRLINNYDEHFDVVVVEGLTSMIYAYGKRFQAPVVSISSLLPFLHCHDIMGNPTHPVYPDMMITDIDNYNFSYRLRGFLYNLWYRAVFYWYILPTEDKIVKKYFGKDMPYLGDILTNTSLMLVNANPIVNIPRANVPNVIDISLMHIRDKKPLPKDLQDFLDSSTNGTIYFSLGTNVNYRNLNTKMIENIIQTFTELPYNVIWKSDIANLPDKPDNVLIKKWVPQQDILGHPNVKVFVTQGGLQSIEEAIYNGVPMVGIPFLVDQPLNINVLVERGIAVRLNYETLTKDDLKNAILEVAENQRYKQKAVEASAILKDQPMKGVDKAIYWIEYVIRHKGAKHLRSPAADMPLYQYFMVDVLLFLFAACCICIFSISKLYRLVRLIRSEKLKKYHKKSKYN